MATKQLIISGTGQSNITSNWIPLMGDGGYAGTDSNAKVAGVMPCAGTFSNLKFHLNVAPGAGTSRTITLQKNGATSGFATTVSETATDAENTGSVTFVAGDTICLRASVSGSPAASPGSWCITFTPDIDGETILLGNTNGGNIATNKFASLACIAGASTSLNQIVMPCAGTFKKLFWKLSDSPGADTSWICSVDKGGVTQALSSTISNTDTTGNDSTNSFTAAVGDLINYSFGSVGAPTARTAYFGVVFLPDTQGQFLLATSLTMTALPGNATGYFGVGASYNNTPNATETSHQYIADAFTMKGLAYNLSTAPGATKSWLFKLRTSDVGDTALTLSIANTDKNGNAQTDVTVAEDTLINSVAYNTGATASTFLRMSYYGYIETEDESSSSSSSTSSSSSSSSSTAIRSSSSSSSSSKSSASSPSSPSSLSSESSSSKSSLSSPSSPSSESSSSISSYSSSSSSTEIRSSSSSSSSSKSSASSPSSPSSESSESSSSLSSTSSPSSISSESSESSSYSQSSLSSLSSVSSESSLSSISSESSSSSSGFPPGWTWGCATPPTSTAVEPWTVWTYKDTLVQFPSSAPYGDLLLKKYKSAVSDVKDTVHTGSKVKGIYIHYNDCDSGDAPATIYWRGSDIIFTQDAALPAWILYSGKVNISVRYVQIRVDS